MEQHIISRELQRHIDAIKKADGIFKKSIFEIAYRLALIADPQEYFLDGTGYNNIVELAEDQFGYARSTTLNYIKIANRYLTGTTKEIRTICADLDDGGKAINDYKVGQLNALPGNVDRDEFKRLDTAGIINKSMSADTIKKTLKEYYKPTPEPEPAPAPDPDDTDDKDTEPGQEQNVPCLTLSVQQIFLNCVTDIIDDCCFETPGTDRAITANNIFKRFFANYILNWILDDDGEIIGAEMIDSNGDVLYTTNEIIN
jgi:hypothetical protein